MTTHYVAHIELDKKPTDEDLEQLLEYVQHLHGVVGTSPRGWLDAQVTVPATSLQAAFLVAVATVQQLAGATALRAEVMTEKEFNAREGFTEIPELLSVSEAAELLHTSRTRIQQMIDEKKFPTAQKVGNAMVIALSDVAAKITHSVFMPEGRTGSAPLGPPVWDDEGRIAQRVVDPVINDGPDDTGVWVLERTELRNGAAIYRRP